MSKKFIAGILAVTVAVQLAAAEKWGEFSFSDSQLENKYVADFKKWNEQEKSGGFGSDTVLCIGSSSMRGWNTIHRDLAPLKVIHRGFGGSSMGQVLIWKNFFLRYPSDTVLMYEGDNDMVNPKVSPQMFIERYQEFCGDLIQANPDVQIYILSVKPSIARWNLWPRMKACNELLEAYAEKEGHVTYIDVASAMLGDDGTPREELLSPKDKLHMTPAGYALWTEHVRSYLLQEQD